MGSIQAQLALIVLLVLLNAAFAGSEIALISLREGQLNRLKERGRAGKTLVRLARDPNRFLATIQIGITLAGFLASATAAVSLAEPLLGLLAPLGAAARPTAIFLVTLVLTFVTLVFGELAPKRLAMQRAESWALLAARPLAGIAVAARPAVWLLGKATDLVVRAVGGDPDLHGDEVTEDELRDMVAMQPELTDEERAVIDGAFEFADRILRDVLVPRREVLGLPADTPAAEAVELLRSSGHSRAPVFVESLDDVRGTVHLRSLIGAEGTVGELVQPALLLPETLGCLGALRRMQAERQQMAIVISEHGGTEGLVTIEDLVEELVGEIWDEADPDVQGVRHHPDGSLTLKGGYPIHDLPEIGVDLPEGDYTTVAGLVLQRLGRVPAPGEQLEVNGWHLRVADADERSIRAVHLHRLDVEREQDGSAAD